MDRRTLLLALAALAAGPVSPLPGQVIRSYESLDRSAGDGGYLTVAFGFNGSVGNTDKAEFDLNGAVGFRGERHWVRLYPAYLVRRQEGTTSELERSLHLRHSYLIREGLATYAFVQVQSDRSLDLDRRLLVGGGLRPRLLPLEGGGVDLGVGAMWEEERIADGGRERSVRGANLLSAAGRAGTATLSLTAFFQPVLDDWSDHRVALAGSATLPLGRGWAVDTAVRWRRDTEPPVGVGRNDAGLSVGLRLAIG
ncbi:MAG: DUF481 domain-containing protein [Longimicrobiales bacterium]|nr:DUF481 domain-containing protein [Longimicrobiales bacterium]